MAIERPNAEYEKDLIVPPFNKRELDANAKENAQEVVDADIEYILFQFHDTADNNPVAGGSLCSAEFEITKNKTENFLIHLNKSLKELGLDYVVTRDNFSTLLPTLSNAVHGLNKILGLLLFYATNVLCGDLDGLGNYIYIGAFGNIIINSSMYNFPASTTDIINCSINKARN